MTTLYYIQNTGNRGDCCVWWRPDGQGYTRDLDDAWKVDEAKAKSICRSRPEQDVMRRADEVEALAVRHVPR